MAKGEFTTRELEVMFGRDEGNTMMQFLQDLPQLLLQYQHQNQQQNFQLMNRALDIKEARRREQIDNIRIAQKQKIQLQN